MHLCLERRDCHPGLLVPFETDVQAFFPEMTDDDRVRYFDQMVVLAIWREEVHYSVARYEGSRQLMEAFLSTMGVCPAEDPDWC